MKKTTSIFVIIALIVNLLATLPFTSFAIEEAVNFVEKFNVEKATFKHKNKLVNLNKKSDAYTILDKLKEPDSRDFDGGLGI